MANILIENLTTFVDLFVEVASRDPISALLVVTSVLLMAVAFGVFGYLTIGAVGSLLIPESLGRTPPRRDR